MDASAAADHGACWPPKLSVTGEISDAAPEPSADSREPDRRQLTIIKRAADRMNRLIGDLLDVANLKAGRLAIEPYEVGPATLAAEAVEMFRPAVEEAGLRIENHLDERLRNVQADGERLLQLLSKLVGSAVKFTPEDGYIMIWSWPASVALPQIW